MKKYVNVILGGKDVTVYEDEAKALGKAGKLDEVEKEHKQPGETKEHKQEGETKEDKPKRTRIKSKAKPKPRPVNIGAGGIKK